MFKHIEAPSNVSASLFRVYILEEVLLCSPGWPQTWFCPLHFLRNCSTLLLPLLSCSCWPPGRFVCGLLMVSSSLIRFPSTQTLSTDCKASMFLAAVHCVFLQHCVFLGPLWVCFYSWAHPFFFSLFPPSAKDCSPWTRNLPSSQVAEVENLRTTPPL